MKFTFPESVFGQHCALLGKTGSGKSSTAKLIIEQVCFSNPSARVCVIDPIKSDWWGLTSMADGRRPGLPFQILGGPRGHVPLHSSAGKAIAEVVASGALPLSIIDMADFEAGGIQHFFVDFAPTLLRKQRGVLYLVIEETHELAPKERAGFAQENMALHWAKKLATAGRSKGIRLILATQRVQSLHNALLGSCETMIVHRLIAPADQDPVKKWLAANAQSKEIRAQVEQSMSSLNTGTGWLCSGEAKIFEQVEFPRIRTYDNTATPTGESELQEVKTAPVDMEHLRAIIGSAVEEAKANDPAELKRTIADLKRNAALMERKLAQAEQKQPEVKQAGQGPQLRQEIKSLTKALELAMKFIVEITTRNFPEAASTDEIKAAVQAAVDRAMPQIQTKVDARNNEMWKLREQAERLIFTLNQIRKSEVVKVEVSHNEPFSVAAPRTASATPRQPSPASNNGHLDGAQQKILDTIAMLNRRGLTPNREMVARWHRVSNRRGLHPTGGTYGQNLAALRAAGYLDGCSLTDTGQKSATEIESGFDAACSTVESGQERILRVCFEHPDKSFTRETMAEALDLHPTGGTYGQNLARLRTMGLIPERGEIKLTEAAYK